MTHLVVNVAWDAPPRHIYARSPPGRGGDYLEALTWKQNSVLASYLGSLAAVVMRLLIPGALQPFVWAFFAIAMVYFFLQYIWRWTAVGYAFGVIVGVGGVVAHGAAFIPVADGTLPVESLFIYIPGLLTALVLIGSSVLAWRER